MVWLRAPEDRLACPSLYRRTGADSRHHCSDIPFRVHEGSIRRSNMTRPPSPSLYGRKRVPAGDQLNYRLTATTVITARICCVILTRHRSHRPAALSQAPVPDIGSLSKTPLPCTILPLNFLPALPLVAGPHAAAHNLQFKFCCAVRCPQIREPLRISSGLD